MSASCKSLALSSSLISSNGHLLPFLRMSSILFHRGCRLKIERRTSDGRNSIPGPNGESCCASSALLKSNSYFANVARLCCIASSEISNLNSGAEGVLHGVPMTCLMRSIKSLGQSKRFSVFVGMLETSSRCSGSAGVETGKLLNSPSISVTRSFVVADR